MLEVIFGFFSNGGKHSTSTRSCFFQLLSSIVARNVASVCEIAASRPIYHLDWGCDTHKNGFFAIWKYFASNNSRRERLLTCSVERRLDRPRTTKGLIEHTNSLSLAPTICKHIVTAEIVGPRNATWGNTTTVGYHSALQARVNSNIFLLFSMKTEMKSYDP